MSKSWELGEATFDLPEMKAKRAALREHPDVISALNVWWDITDADGNGVIDRDEYILLGKALYRVIINDGNEKAAQESAENDWEEDCRGNETMDEALFKQAIFELVDLWTDTLDAVEYVDFLMSLLEKMKLKGLGSDLLNPKVVAVSPPLAEPGVSS